MADRTPRRSFRPSLDRLETRQLLATYEVAGPSLAARVLADRATTPFLIARDDLDVLVPADYDGDGRAEPALYRTGTGNWYRLGADGQVQVDPIGAARQVIPVPADYDGDGRADLVIFDPRTALWAGYLSGGGSLYQSFGAAGLVDLPVPADYDGDGRADLAVFRIDTAEWFVAGSKGPRFRLQFGQGGRDRPVPADYDGDGRDDPAVFRPDTAQWFVAGSSGIRLADQFGQGGRDRPIPADFDGDGRADLAVFRPDTAQWFLKATRQGPSSTQFGQAGLDAPVPADFDGDGRADLAIARPTSGWWAFLGTRAGTATKTLDPAVVPYPVQFPSWLLQHQIYRTQAARPGTRVAFYGDSITYRWGDADRLAVGSPVWNSDNRPRDAANFGIDSDVTQGLLWRVRHGELPKGLDVAVVEIGTNNLGPTLAETPAEVARGVETIVRAIQEQSPGTKVLVMGIFPRGNSPTDPFRARIRETNARLSAIDDGYFVRYLDIGDRFLTPDGMLNPLLISDSIHPTLLGYRVWADAIREQLDSMLTG